MLARTLQTSSLGSRLRARPLALVGLILVAGEALLALVGAESGGLAVIVLLLAPGLALLPLLPAPLRRVPAAALAAAPALGFAAASTALISASSAGLPLNGTVCRLTIGLVVIVGLLALRGDEPVAPAGAGAGLQAAALAAVLAIGIVLQERVIGGSPIPGNDWAKYILYADEIRRQGSLLIDNPYWMLGSPFREDPGAPALYGAYLTLTGRAAPAAIHGIWVLSIVGVLATFAFARAFWGPVAGVLAAAFAIVPPITQDILAWHGLANVAALALLPLVLAYATTLLDDRLALREAAGFALVLVALAAAHRLSLAVGLAGIGLAVALAALRAERRRALFAGIGVTAGFAVVLGGGVAYDLITRSRTFGGTLDYSAYLGTKAELDKIAYDLTLPFTAVALVAVVLAVVAARRDRRLWPVLCVLAVVSVLAFSWIVHVPLVYFRMAYYLPLVLAPLIAAVMVVRLGARRAALAGATLVIACSVLSWIKSSDLRGFYGFANPTSLRGLDIVSARLEAGDVVVTDRCWSFLGTWLLHTPTLAALEPEDIQPRAELRRARQARAVLQGTPRGRALAEQLGIRYMIVDPTCVDAKGEDIQPPATGSTVFFSKRLAVLEL